jgi:hypothetical protein
MINWDEYRDPLGFMAGKPNPTQPESNAVLFSAIERILRLKLGTWGPDEQRRLNGAILTYCLSPEGKLIRPKPWTQDIEQPDDHIGLGATGCDSAIFRVLCFLDQNKAWNHFFMVRFSGIYAHLQWGMGVTPDWWRRWWWEIATGLWPAKDSEQDPWVQKWLMVEIAGARGAGEQKASELFWQRFHEAYPYGFEELFTAYWTPEHPVVQAWRQIEMSDG